MKKPSVKKSEMLEIVCSYCKKHMGWKNGENTVEVSHSICDECLEKELKKV